jgi:hypothetical protein
MISTSVQPEVSEAAAQLDRLLAARALKDVAASGPARSNEGIWGELFDGGWLDIGATTRLVDVVEVARVWGRHPVDLPFLETVLVSRWAPTSRQHVDRTHALTFAISGRNEAIAPFFGRPNVSCIARLPTTGELELIAASGEIEDDFSPVLPVGRVGQASELGPVNLREIAAVYAAEGIGAAEIALATSVEYATQRFAYGRPIGSFQAVRHLLADMHRDVEIAKSALLWCSQGDESAPEASRLALTLCAEAVKLAIQVHGGIGYTWDVGLHLHLRRIIVLQEVAEHARIAAAVGTAS